MSFTGGSTATEWVPTGSVTVRVPGKVNLYLTVGDLRDDGYHDLTTVFHAVSLFDQVTVRNADLMSVEVVGIGADKVPTDRRNLAWQAAELLASHVGRVPDVAITIEKSIPVAGGMAGGSADAAGVLVAMNSLWELGLPRADLHMLAARLGSDVPFALHGGTALGTGRGEELTTVLARSSFHWVLALPTGGLSTPAVFAEIDRLRAGRVLPEPRVSDDLMAALRSGNARALGNLLANDLQPAACSLRPDLEQTLEAGREVGALGALVSGSGPTVVFLVNDGEHALDVCAGVLAAEVAEQVFTVSGPVHGARVIEERP